MSAEVAQPRANSRQHGRGRRCGRCRHRHLTVAIGGGAERPSRRDQRRRPGVRAKSCPCCGPRRRAAWSIRARPPAPDAGKPLELTARRRGGADRRLTACWVRLRHISRVRSGCGSPDTRAGPGPRAARLRVLPQADREDPRSPPGRRRTARAHPRRRGRRGRTRTGGGRMLGQPGLERTPHRRRPRRMDRRAAARGRYDRARGRRGRPSAPTTAGVGLRLPRRHLLPRREEHPRPGADERARPTGLPAHVLHQLRGGRAAARSAAGTRAATLSGGRSTTPAAWASNRPPTSGTPPHTSGNGRTPAESHSVATACRSTCPAPTTTHARSSAPWTGPAARATTTTSSARAEELPVVRGLRTRRRAATCRRRGAVHSV